jgi:hypothetical protein
MSWRGQSNEVTELEAYGHCGDLKKPAQKAIHVVGQNQNAGESTNRDKNKPSEKSPKNHPKQDASQYQKSDSDPQKKHLRLTPAPKAIRLAEQYNLSMHY